MSPRGSPHDGLEGWSGRLVGAGVVAASLLSVGVGIGVWLFGLTGWADPARIRAVIAGTGPYAPVVFVAVQALQVIVAPIPGQLLAGVGGYLFGGRLGTVYSMVGVVIGSSIVFGLARGYGRPVVAGLVAEDTRERFERFGAENGHIALLVFFLLPTFPDDALCVLAGLWNLRARTFLALLIVGRTPSFYAAAYAGTSLQDGAFDRIALVLAVLAVAVVAIHLGRDRIERWLNAESSSGDS